MKSSVPTWVAIGVTVCGSMVTTAVNWGATGTKITQLQKDVTDVGVHVTKHDDQLSAIKEQNARIEQSLTDIKETVHAIQDKGNR